MSDKDLQESSKVQEFKPTLAMNAFIDKAIQLMSDNIAEITREAGIDESNYYKWIKDEQFRLWYKAEWDKRLAIVGPQLDAMGLKQAKRDHKYWESMQKRVGNLKEEKNTNVQINNFIPILGQEKVE